jgi:hypothetical protein
MIQEFEKFSEVELQDITRNTLILLDIDNNIIMHKQLILRDGNLNYRERFFNIIRGVYGDDKVDELWRRSSIRILDNTFTNFFGKYRDNCVGFTARRTGKPSENSDDNIEEKIYHELKGLGVEFDPKVIKNEYIKFAAETDSKLEAGIKDFYIMNGPMFKNGIVFTCNCNKAHVLSEFMKVTGCKPDKIYVFDDRRKNLDDVMLYCKSAGIPFVGYHNVHYAKNYSGEKFPQDIVVILNSHQHADQNADRDANRDADILIEYYES